MKILMLVTLLVGLGYSLDWTQLSVSGDIPSRRAFPATATHGLRYVFTFGGMVQDYLPTGFQNVTPLGEMHKFDTWTNTWTKLNPTGDVPSPRGGSVMTAIGGKLYLFGGGFYNGFTFAITLYNDLFRYDIANNAWEDITPVSGSPSSRMWFGGDSGNDEFELPRDLYIFGGFGGLSMSGLIGFNDLWKYDTTDEEWVQVHNGSGVAPAGRDHLGFINYLNHFVMFGGETFVGFSPSPNNQTWIFHDGEWQHQDSWNLPTPNDGMQYAMRLGKLYMFGGDTPVTDERIPPNFAVRKNITDDTLRFNLLTKSWEQLNLAHSPPPNEFGRMETILGESYLMFGYNLIYDFSDPEEVTFTQPYMTDVWKLS